MRTCQAFFISVVILISGLAHAQSRYGVVLAGRRNIFWPAMMAGIQKASSDLGVKVLIRAPVDDDPESVKSQSQVRMIRWMEEQKVEAIILAPMPLSEKSGPVPISVPVIFIDRDSKDFKSESLIATNNYAAGRAAAENLKDKLHKGSKIGVFRLEASVVSTTAREKGFTDRAKELGWVVVMDASTGHDIRASEQIMEKLLKSEKHKIDAVFASSGRTTLSAIIAVKKLDEERRPLLVGFDYRNEFAPALKDGTLLAVIVQDPYEMGYRAVKELVESRQQKRKMEKNIWIDYTVVTKENISFPLIQEKLRFFRTLTP